MSRQSIGLAAERWVRPGPEVFYRGQWIPAKWHLVRERERLSVKTKCGQEIAAPLDYETRRTDPAVATRCGRCA